MPIHKIFLSISLLLATTIMADSINWAKDYQSGIKQAIKENKPMFFVISRDTCKYCVILKKTTFKDKKVIEALNKDYISIIAQIDENDYVPKDLYAPGLPALWFLKEDGTPLFQPLMGMIESNDFLEALRIVNEEFSKTQIKDGK
ncbi:MAG: DUF255 domain-containing protein [Campylobacterota bacterium]|nr:DUF255 domain-containing protein [Campylobacterota bacterium]